MRTDQPVLEAAWIPNTDELVYSSLGWDLWCYELNTGNETKLDPRVIELFLDFWASR